MKSQCNYIPEKIWVREVENEIRHITLRDNFEEKTIVRDGENEVNYEFDEVNVYIVNRDNIESYVSDNFELLFEQGTLQEGKPEEPSLKDRIEQLEILMQEVM